ncbi:hypothetical protein JHJ32_21960 [Parapedobacter sp. ISTM3]|uniref:hypothetical protein n=1 Tax=Parapedobacter sp. ISTM3 TaxID=2800130 RepID=UPI00190592F0|nr:hypothetical protein [Parapedobacter sp. ISTM3]MBK1442681.1 hypothetical protein [Parapedobacter sp. ISTM3]
MASLNGTFQIDGLRFIDNSHTTNRQLGICSKIVKELKDSQIPKNILINKLVNWSAEKERINKEYFSNRGKITNGGRPTTAIGHYLNLCDSLGLVSRFNNVYSSTRIGGVLAYFYDDDLELNMAEKLFYTFQLLNIDADALILILTLLEDRNQLNQKDFQKEFSQALNDRLEKKRYFSTGSARFNIAAKLLKVSMIWKNPIKYAEHMVAPRCEWLKSLGLLNIRKDGASTIYTRNSLGSYLFNQLPEFDNNLRDVSRQWLEDNFFAVFGSAFNSNAFAINNINEDEVIIDAIKLSFTTIKSSNTFRLPAFESFLFICIQALTKANKIVGFGELIFAFSQGIKLDNRKLFLKKGARINESYISSVLL